MTALMPGLLDAPLVPKAYAAHAAALPLVIALTPLAFLFSTARNSRELADVLALLG